MESQDHSCVESRRYKLSTWDGVLAGLQAHWLTLIRSTVIYTVVVMFAADGNRTVAALCLSSFLASIAWSLIAFARSARGEEHARIDPSHVRIVRDDVVVDIPLTRRRQVKTTPNGWVIEPGLRGWFIPRRAFADPAEVDRIVAELSSGPARFSRRRESPHARIHCHEAILDPLRHGTTHRAEQPRPPASLVRRGDIPLSHAVTSWTTLSPTDRIGFVALTVVVAALAWLIFPLRFAPAIVAKFGSDVHVGLDGDWIVHMRPTITYRMLPPAITHVTTLDDGIVLYVKNAGSLGVNTDAFLSPAHHQAFATAIGLVPPILGT